MAGIDGIDGAFDPNDIPDDAYPGCKEMDNEIERMEAGAVPSEVNFTDDETEDLKQDAFGKTDDPELASLLNDIDATDYAIKQLEDDAQEGAGKDGI